MEKLSVQTLVALAAGVILLLGGPLTASAANVDLFGTHTFASIETSPGLYHVTGNLTMESGSSITCNDPGGNASACQITIMVDGFMLMKDNSAILAEDNNVGGNGGDISITVGKNLILCGTTASADGDAAGCGSRTPLGALISSSKNAGAGDTGHAGKIIIHVSGDKVTEEPGAVIKANGTGPAGAIEITGGKDIDINGSVLAQGGPTTVGLGGPISIIAKCNLDITDAGIVSSRGRDPGADLVHLQAGCDVKVYGLVESTGPGHQNPPPPNKCNPAGKIFKNSTACVEVWAGQDIEINSVFPPHKGEINADTAQSGGTQGLGWIDVFARRDIRIIDGTGNDHVGGTVHALHANQYLGQGGHGGLITVKAKGGMVSTSGNAIQANDTVAGGDGGTVDVQAGGPGSPAGDVAFDSASIQAKGGTGSGSSGGTIKVQSFNGQITGNGGELNAGGGGPAGTVTLTSCVGDPASTYKGTVTGNRTNNPGVCSDTLVIPVLPFCTGDCGCPTT